MNIAVLFYAITYFPSFQLATIPKELTQRREFLTKFGFKQPEIASKYSQNDGSFRVGEISRIFLDENFLLLYKCFNEPNSQFNGDEIEDLVSLANEYLATGKGIESIVKCISKSSNPLSHLLRYEYFCMELKRQPLSIGNGIELNRDEIILEGLDVTLETKQNSINALVNLSLFFTSITIKNIPINNEDYGQIQLAFNPNLTSIRFVECPFQSKTNSEWYFNFQHLTHLSCFEYSGFYWKNLTKMLGTIPKENLVELNISNTGFFKKENDQLINTLNSFKNLKILNVSFDTTYQIWKTPLNVETLLFSNLVSLNLCGNFKIDSFCNALDNLKELLNLEYLNLSIEPFDKFPLTESFAINLFKFPVLKVLDLSDTRIPNFSTFIENFHQLKSLEEFIYNWKQDFIYFNSLLNKIKNEQLRVRVNFRETEFEIKNIFYLFSLVHVDIKNIPPSSFTTTLPEKDFIATHLTVDLSHFPALPLCILVEFFSKFKNVKQLTVHLNLLFNFVILKPILGNNLIDHLEFIFDFEFTQFTELKNTIQNHYFRKLTIKGKKNSIFLISDHFVHKLIDIGVWNELEEFECKNFTYKALIYLIEWANLSSKLQKVTIGYRPIPHQQAVTTKILSTVKQVTVYVEQPNTSTTRKHLSQLIKIFPSITELQITSHFQSIDCLDFSQLKNLRSLSIVGKGIHCSTKFFKQFSLSPFLTRFFLFERNIRCKILVSQGRHLMFPTLEYVHLKTRNILIREIFAPYNCSNNSFIASCVNSSRYWLLNHFIIIIDEQE